MPQLSDTDHPTHTICPFCGAIHDLATGIDHDRAPSEGAFSVCFRCSSVSVFDANLQLRPATSADFEPLTEKELKDLATISAASKIIQTQRKKIN